MAIGPFAKLLAGASAKRPSQVETVPPSAFVDTWSRKTWEPVKVGIRTVSEKELTAAMKLAALAAWDEFPDATRDEELRLEVFNDNVITNVLARACTGPEDISQFYFAPAPEDLIRAALTPGGVRHLWSAYERHTIATNPLGEELSADGIAALADTIKRSGPMSPRAGRLAAALNQELTADG